MAMHNPPHPGEFITEVYLKPNNLSRRELASKLGRDEKRATLAEWLTAQPASSNRESDLRIDRHRLPGVWLRPFFFRQCLVLLDTV